MREERFAADREGRLDRFLAEASGLTRNQVQRLIREGAVEVNGAPAPAACFRPGTRCC